MSNTKTNLEYIEPEVIKPLGSIVKQEANVIFSTETISPDPELIADGWERRFVADGSRVKEALDLYTEMGLDTRAEPVKQDQMAEKCEGCHIHMMLNFKTIYTRKKQG